MPPLWGTRRIGPDLIRRGGRPVERLARRPLLQPARRQPVSVMPAYPWFFEDDGLTPNKTGLSIIAYVQWLGSWEPLVDESIYELPDDRIALPRAGARLAGAAAPRRRARDARPKDDFWGEEG